MGTKSLSKYYMLRGKSQNDLLYIILYHIRMLTSCGLKSSNISPKNFKHTKSMPNAVSLFCCSFSVLASKLAAVKMTAGTYSVPQLLQLLFKMELLTIIRTQSSAYQIGFLFNPQLTLIGPYPPLLPLAIVVLLFFITSIDFYNYFKPLLLYFL